MAIRGDLSVLSEDGEFPLAKEVLLAFCVVLFSLGYVIVCFRRCQIIPTITAVAIIRPPMDIRTTSCASE